MKYVVCYETLANLCKIQLYIYAITSLPVVVLLVAVLKSELIRMVLLVLLLLRGLKFESSLGQSQFSSLILCCYA